MCIVDDYIFLFLTTSYFSYRENDRKTDKWVRLSSDILRSFMGEGDVVMWLHKLVANLQKIEDIATLIPMYLEGNALAVYLEMGEKDQADTERIEKRLKTAFLEGDFEVYNKLRKVTWTEEPVDVNAAEIRRLARLVGYMGQSLKKTIKMVFMGCFLDCISMELQWLAGIENMEVKEVLRHAKVLVKQTSELGVVATFTKSKPGKVEQTVRRPNRKFIGKCFRCQGLYLMRDCKEPRRTLPVSGVARLDTLVGIALLLTEMS